MENTTEHKRIERNLRQMAILPKHSQGDILIPFHKRNLRFPMKDCPDSKATGILTVNRMFGGTDCRDDFAEPKGDFFMKDHWSIEAVAERIATPNILLATTLDDGESAYKAALSEYQKMPIENLLPILDATATIEAFIGECHTFCHLRAVAVVREIHANLHKGINALN